MIKSATLLVMAAGLLAGSSTAAPPTSSAAGRREAAGPERPSAATVFEGVGANAAALQPTVDAFRAALGPSNGVGGTFASGRREINWDGVPSGSRNPFPVDFFNTTSARGVVLSTPGTRFQVSGDCPGSTCLFDDVTNGYQGTVEFESFSPQRIFAPIGSNVTAVDFFVPGTSTPASVRGFGAVFCDAEFADGARIDCMDPQGNVVYSRNVLPAPVFMKGFGFLGFVFGAGDVITRIVITAGYGAIDAPQGGGEAVTLDDFIYGEPNSPPAFTPAASLVRQKGTSGLETLGTATDLQSPAGSLQVALGTPGTAGITATGLSESAGTVSGTLAVDCSAPVNGGPLDLVVSDGDRQTLGSVNVTVVYQPVVTPPAAVSVTQSLCQGALRGATLSTLQTRWPSQQAALAAFLLAGSATEYCANPVTRLDPTFQAALVQPTTFFPEGANVVTFRFLNNGGYVGTATANVNVQRAGDVDLDGDVDVFDLVILSGAIVGNYAPGTAPYLALATTGDADGNFTLDIFDLVLAAGHTVGNVACLAPQI